MNKIKFEADKDGFYGVYYENPIKANAAMIIMLGDNAESYMSGSAAKWAIKRGINAMTVSPAEGENGYHNFPLERIGAAVKWLKKHGNSKISIAGASTTGTIALAAASYFHDITLTVAMTPSDFMWEGFGKGKKDGCGEWPVDGQALLSYGGKPLPYMPFVYRHPDYWNMMKKESKETGNMVAARRIFDDSEKVHPISEEEFIKVENIKGRLILVGASDDVLWDTEKYIRRMEKRLKAVPHDCKCSILIYDHGTHFVFPEGMVKTMLPVGSGLLVKLMFAEGRKYSKECRAARIDIDKKVTKAIEMWKGSKT